MKDYLDISNNGQATFKVSRTSKAENLIKEKRFDEALAEIDRILKDDDGYENLNLKGIILDNLSRYGEAIGCFNRALEQNNSEEIQMNKANCLYKWAKISFFPEGNYDKALELINNGITTIPDSEDSSEFYFLKAEILEALNDLVESHKAYLIAYGEFERLEEFEKQTDYLQNTTDTLINIVGCDFYGYTPVSGNIVNLVRDEENEHDSDAIAVLVNEKTVGYVANSDYTLIEEVKSASNIKNQISDDQKAKILFIYLGEYVVAKII